MFGFASCNRIKIVSPNIGQAVTQVQAFPIELPPFKAFGLDTPELLERRGVDVHSLFGNLREVVDVSEEFLATLQGRESLLVVICVSWRLKL